MLHSWVTPMLIWCQKSLAYWDSPAMLTFLSSSGNSPQRTASLLYGRNRPEAVATTHQKALHTEPLQPGPSTEAGIRLLLEVKEKAKRICCHLLFINKIKICLRDIITSNKCVQICIWCSIPNTKSQSKGTWGYNLRSVSSVQNVNLYVLCQIYQKPI